MVAVMATVAGRLLKETSAVSLSSTCTHISSKSCSPSCPLGHLAGPLSPAPQYTRILIIILSTQLGLIRDCSSDEDMTQHRVLRAPASGTVKLQLEEKGWFFSPRVGKKLRAARYQPLWCGKADLRRE